MPGAIDRGALLGRAAAQETIVVVGRGANADDVSVTTRLTDSDGRVLVDQHERVWVRPDGDGNYMLTVTVPEPELAKRARWTVHALLAPGATPRANADGRQDPSIDGGRTVLSWSGEADPPINVIWTYLKIV